MGIRGYTKQTAVSFLLSSLWHGPGNCNKISEKQIYAANIYHEYSLI